MLLGSPPSTWKETKESAGTVVHELPCPRALGIRKGGGGAGEQLGDLSQPVGAVSMVTSGRCPVWGLGTQTGLEGRKRMGGVSLLCIIASF